ncbi:MAG: hypothetical protein HDT28_04360 [Clostridiales bacterium]|nr:hypothetical protein [Clostridiales bacterium]
MKSDNKYDKKKLIILRAALIALGAAVGGTAVWQYFVFYPQVMREEFRIIVIIVSALALAALLGLSAKPLYNLFVSVRGVVGSELSALGGKGVAAVVLGLVTAGVFAFVVDVMIKAVYDILAVRILIGVLVYIVFAALCCYGFTRFLAEDEEKAMPIKFNRGYLLTVDSLFDERVDTVAQALPNVKTLDNAYKALLLAGGDGNAAALRLSNLVSSGSVAVIRSTADFSSMDEYREIEKKIALSKRLKRVTVDGVQDDGALSIELFAKPQDNSEPI